MVAWPASLPTCVLRNSASGGPQDNRASFQPEVGPSIDRPRTTAVVDTYSVVLGDWTLAQVAEFERFFREDIAFGATPFDWFHPIHHTSGKWRIVKADPAYTIRRNSRRGYQISMSVMSMPGSY